MWLARYSSLLARYSHLSHWIRGWPVSHSSPSLTTRIKWNENCLKGLLNSLYKWRYISCFQRKVSLEKNYWSVIIDESCSFAYPLSNLNIIDAGHNCRFSYPYRNGDCWKLDKPLWWCFLRWFLRRTECLPTYSHSGHGNPSPLWFD